MQSSEGNIYALMRLIFNKLSAIRQVFISLIKIMFTMVQVTARLIEYLLDVMVQTHSYCTYAIAVKVLRVLIITSLVWWIYFDRLIWPVFSALINSPGSSFGSSVTRERTVP
jgi:hypothetical protein